MRKEHKLIAAGIGLFGYGVLIGWAITGDRIEHKMKSNQLVLKELLDRKQREVDRLNQLLFDQPALEAMAERHEQIDRLQQEASTHWPAPEEAAYSTTTGVETEVVDSEREIPPGETPDKTERNLQNLIDMYSANPEEVDAFNSMVLANKEVEDTPPFVISNELFAFDPEEGDEYEKTTLAYYPKYRILLDEENDQIDGQDVNLIVGWSNLNRFGDESNDADTVFVRNRYTKTDYEVVQHHDDPPAHVRFGVDEHTYRVQRAKGKVRFREGD